jgi:hypothetical protein
MNRSGKLPFLVAVLLAVLGFGCSSRPEQEIKAAQDAMKEADTQHASEFAAAEYQEAKQSWDDAQAALSGSRYGEAKPLLLKAKVHFVQAGELAKAKRDRILAEAKSLQSTIDVRYESLKGLIQGSKKSLSAKASKSLDDLGLEIDQGIDKIKTEIQQGEYALAKVSAQKAMAKVEEAERQLHLYMTGK